MPTRWLRRWTLGIVFPLLGATVGIGGIVELGLLAQDSVASDPRYFFGVQAIECNLPTGQNRQRFLDEVHYYGQLPEQCQLLDPELPTRLSKAFARHPQVERVVAVSVSPGQKVRVQLLFRE